MPNDNKISQLLSQIYNPEIAPVLGARLNTILDKHRSRIPKPSASGLNERDVLLITYPDQVQEPDQKGLTTLYKFCDKYLSGLITSIHILPFYPWSSDDGFSVINYREVARDYGEWSDIHTMSSKFRLMFDAVINHISVESPWFQAFLRGDKSYSDYFIEVRGQPDLSKVFRPRTLPLLTPFNTTTGIKEIWTTFSGDQADLKYQNPDVLLEIIDILLFYAEEGAEFIRLDAIAYLWKEVGTSCIHLKRTHLVVQLFRAILDEVAPHVRLITETNVPHLENLSYFGDGHNEASLIYNFSLPPLVLHAFHSGSAKILAEWAGGLNLPSNKVTFLNFLASHDGIGLGPLRGILTEGEIDNLVNKIGKCGGLISYKSNANGTQSPYEANINYLDALSTAGEPIEMTIKRFLSAHAVLFSLAGLPAIYFHSLFGSRGWSEGAVRTGRNRSINREKLKLKQLQSQLEEKGLLRAQVFNGLSKLIKARARHPAFSPFGKQRVQEIDARVFAVLRIDPATEKSVLCLHNVTSEPVLIKMNPLLTSIKPKDELSDLITGTRYPPGKASSLSLSPYQCVWLTERTGSGEQDHQILDQPQ